ncbi:hypothetical protein [Dialister micraerophilus]|uniref:hypothetical protein n=1 Tax=Dialister micraerophilus TaxID=309120 RepID=UPI0023F45DF5|nr:hypothetical protein [Dialister micraerophilus]
MTDKEKHLRAEISQALTRRIYSVFKKEIDARNRVLDQLPEKGCETGRREIVSEINLISGLLNKVRDELWE